MAKDNNLQRTSDVVQRGRLKLTEEEKAVLLSCRRNSVGRGFAAGVLTTIALRYFGRQGMLPQPMVRWSWFYYSGGFLFSFVIGASSYRQKCFDQIMALDNSVLADQVRIYKQKAQDCLQEEEKSCSQQPDNNLDEHPNAFNKSTTTSDNHDSLPSGNPYYTHDQPTMFQRTPIGESDTSYTKQRKGRTFDEIREYNRRQQTQPNYSQQAQWMEVQQQRQQKERKENHNSGSEPRLQERIPRRNKYGDIVYEDD